MSKRTVISQAEFIALLADQKGALPVSIIALTNADAKKSAVVIDNDTGEEKKIHNPHPTILKQIRMTGWTGASYERSVNKELTGNPDAKNFVAAKRSWGKWLVDNKIAEHTPKGETKKRYYLRTQSTPTQRRRCPVHLMGYRDTQGKYLEHSTVKPFLPAPSLSEKQSAHGLGNEPTEQVWVREYQLDSILSVKLNGKKYILAKG